MDAPLLSATVGHKTYKKVRIACRSTFCSVQFDDDHWTFLKKSAPAETHEEWEVTLPDGSKARTEDVKSWIETILRERLQEVCVNIYELSFLNWTGSYELFRSVDITKLQHLFLSRPAPVGFLQPFVQKRFTHLTIFNFHKPSEYFDDLKNIAVGHLAVHVKALDDREKLTSFNAGRWAVTEHFHKEATGPPRILEFVDKMLTDEAGLYSVYKAECKAPVDMTGIIEAVKQKYPNAQTCAETSFKRFLSIKLEDREINVFEMQPQRFYLSPYTYGVLMERKGAAKGANETGFCNLVAVQYTKFRVFIVAVFLPILDFLEIRFPMLPISRFKFVIDDVMEMPMFVFCNLFLLLLVLLAAFFFQNSLILVVFLPFWLLFVYYLFPICVSSAHNMDRGYFYNLDPYQL